MRKTIFLFLVFTLVLLAGCSKKNIEKCESNLYTKDGKCCTYVCNKECPSGYIENTCNCECNEDGNLQGNGASETNVDDIFDDGGDVEPPILPK